MSDSKPVTRRNFLYISTAAFSAAGAAAIGIPLVSQMNPDASGFIWETRGIPIAAAPAALKAAVEIYKKFLLVTGLESDKFVISCWIYSI